MLVSIAQRHVSRASRLPARLPFLGLGIRQLLLSSALLLTAGCGDNPPVQSAIDEGPTTRAPSERRNLIFVVIDTLRPDYLGSYGGSVPTPFLDGLAASGARFVRNYSHAPMTGPSHASMFTAGLPSDHGCLVNSQSLDPANQTLAETLSAAGYSTAGFVSLGVLRKNFGFSQGFDLYSDGFAAGWWKSADELNQTLGKWLPRRSTDAPTFLFLHYSDPHTPYAPPNESYPIVELRQDGERLASLPSNSRPTKITVTLQPGANDIPMILPGGESRESLGFGRIQIKNKQITVAFDNGDERGVLPRPGGSPSITGMPVMLRLINSTSAPITVDALVTLRMNLGEDQWPLWYAKEVAFVDEQLAHAADALHEAGLWENSVIVFTSDHGEALGEHDHMQHVEQLYDSLLRVPLVIVAPGRIPPGSVIETPVRHVDIVPTVLELLDVPPFSETRGISLLPLIDGDAQQRRPLVVSETHRPEARHDQRSVVYEGYKYIINDVTNAEELYDLRNDPGELLNLAPSKAALVEKLRGALAAELLRTFGPGVTQVGWDDLSPEDRAQLEALGYTR
ncbi:MAG: arylsulfatase A-like enzyme [Pseudohongiellaceae bacterium]|jgi:arylsulfatase A-like enzyme